MFEIELKAHVINRPETEKILHSFAEYTGFTEKYDVYWHGNKTDSLLSTRLRIRQSHHELCKRVINETIVTYKHKSMKDEVEVNDEKEFTVSSKDDFEFFIISIGFKPTIKKHKITESWKFENVSIEVSVIEGLGDFIEIEILSQTDDSLTIEKHRKKLYEVLHLCGVPQSAIETRYYTEMLCADN